MANSITWLADKLGFENSLSGGDSAYIGERDKVSSISKTHRSFHFMKTLGSSYDFRFQSVWIRDTDGTPYSASEVDRSFVNFDIWWRKVTERLRLRVDRRGLRDTSLKDVSEYVRKMKRI